MSEPRPILIEVSPGELVDRLTIAQIRTRRLRDPVRVRLAKRELTALARIRRTILPTGDHLDGLATQLQAVNEQLWTLEDEIRSRDTGDSIAELARRICRANDRRALLKQRINAVLGVAGADGKVYFAAALAGRASPCRPRPRASRLASLRT